MLVRCVDDIAGGDGNQVERQIAAATERGPFLTRLLERDRVLFDEANAIDAGQPTRLLGLPEVIQAGEYVVLSLPREITMVARNLPQVRHCLRPQRRS